MTITDRTGGYTLDDLALWCQMNMRMVQMMHATMRTKTHVPEMAALEHSLALSPSLDRDFFISLTIVLQTD